MLCVLEASAVFPQCLQSFVCFREQCKMIDDLVQRFPRQWREDSTSCEIIQYHCSFIGSMQSVTSAQLSLLCSSFAPTPACDVPGILGDTHMEGCLDSGVAAALVQLLPNLTHLAYILQPHQSFRREDIDNLQDV